MIRRTLVTLALTTGLVASGATAASAHECFIANRSAQGNVGASHSANWYTLQLEDLFRSAHMFLGGPALTEEQVDLAMTMLAAEGLPSSVTMFERLTIPRSLDELEGVSTKAADGKGVDHFFTAHGDTLVGIFFAAQAS